MISLPFGEESTDMGFRVGFTVEAGIGVRHGVVLGFFWEFRKRVGLPLEGSAEVGVVNRLAIGYRMARISPGKPPRARGRIGQ